MEAIMQKIASLRCAAMLPALLLVLGCNPYQFTMGKKYFVNCEIMAPLETVEKTNNVATMHERGAFDMSYFGATQYLFQTDTRLINGEGYRVLIRPVVELHSVIDSGIVLTVSTNGVTLDSAHQRFVSRSDVKLKQNGILPLSLLSDDHFLQIVVGCDTVYKGWSPRKESDDLFFSTIGKSDVQIIAPEWAGVPE